MIPLIGRPAESRQSPLLMQVRTARAQALRRSPPSRRLLTSSSSRFPPSKLLYFFSERCEGGCEFRRWPSAVCRRSRNRGTGTRARSRGPGRIAIHPAQYHAERGMACASCQASSVGSGNRMRSVELRSIAGCVYPTPASPGARAPSACPTSNAAAEPCRRISRLHLARSLASDEARAE